GRRTTGLVLNLPRTGLSRLVRDARLYVGWPGVEQVGLDRVERALRLVALVIERGHAFGAFAGAEVPGRDPRVLVYEPPEREGQAMPIGHARLEQHAEVRGGRLQARIDLGGVAGLDLGGHLAANVDLRDGVREPEIGKTLDRVGDLQRVVVAVL